MELSKDNIVSKHFSKKLLRGLDEFEVRDFLHVLAEEIRHLSQKSALQKKQIQEQESLIRDYRDREHILKESIVSAEKWAEKIRKDAESNSSLVLEKAHSKSEALIQEARHSLQSVYNDIADLKRLQLQFKTGLKAALQVQMDLLEQDPIFSPSSTLSSTDRDHFLEQTKSPVKKEDNDLKSEPCLEEGGSIKELSLQDKELSGTLKVDEKELASLKESLSSLNKSFS